jgi:hypothetical protein
MRLLLLLLAFILLAVFGRWYYVCQIRGECGEKPSANDLRLATLGLRADGKAVLDGFDHFYFPPNSPNPQLNDNNRLFLDRAAAFLDENPRLHLCIIGNFGLDEQGSDAGFFENLGLQRASRIRQELLNRGITLDRLSLDYNPGASGVRQQPLEFNTYDIANTIDFARLAYTFSDMTFSDENFVRDTAVYGE